MFPHKDGPYSAPRESAEYGFIEHRLLAFKEYEEHC